MVGGAGGSIESNATGEITARVIIAGANGQVINRISSINGKRRVEIASNGIEDIRPAIGRAPAVPDGVAAVVAVVIGFIEFFSGADVVASDRASHAAQRCATVEGIVQR